MPPPPDLVEAIASLPTDSRVERTEDWVERPNGAWSFLFRARLSAPASQFVPEWSGWHLVVTGTAANRDIDIYPDASTGIVATFPHQNVNDTPVDGLPWRTGKPCLERPASIFQRDAWGGEPLDLAERLIWHIHRLLLWMDAAAEDRLLIDGDPLELPMYPTTAQGSILGFHETQDGLEWWNQCTERWGFATLSEIPGAHATVVISEFMDPRRRRLRTPSWSPVIPKGNRRVDAVWVALPRRAVIAPWRAAFTWYELSELCAAVSVDLPAILADAGASLRHTQRPKQTLPTHLLLGFPLEATVGGPDERFHWVAVQNMQLCGRSDVRSGFPDRSGARRAWDRDRAMSSHAVVWRHTANWAPDQLRKRGEAEDTVRTKSLLLLGCGTLGAAVAEHLLRMGVTRMGVLDHDTMHMGNLSRHTLTMADIGHAKANRLARRLNLAAPDAQVTALPVSFPPSNADAVDLIKDWDIVLDCTASDAVMREMAQFDWKTERIFVSLAMTWRANGLFAYTACETGFPAIDAIERFRAAAPAPETEAVSVMEGIGCWHPVFPATSDDVALWGAIGSKFVRRAILEKTKMAALYQQREDGSIDRVDV